MNKGPKNTLFDAGYDQGVLWGEAIDPTKAKKGSWQCKAQYIAGVKLGQQEHKRQKLQQLVMKDPK